jgi:uncharacterized membrane protein
MSSATDNATMMHVDRNISIRKVDPEAPWDWMSAGWRDFWVHPLVSFSFGIVYFGLALLMFFGATQAGLQSLILALGGGFMIIAPLFAVGLYETSRRIEAGEDVTLASVIWRRNRSPGQLGFLGAVLAFVYYLWIQLAFLLFLLFFGGGGAFPPIGEWIPTLLFKPHGLGMLIIGTAVGAFLAATAFAISVVSIPLMMVHRIDAVSAMNVSIRAVAYNPGPMALWATLIAATVAIGMVTFFVGLIFVFPVLGHASWHVFRSVVQLADD